MRRACDACTIRKVKCDGTGAAQPCSNCRMSNLACQYLRQIKKRGRKSRSVRHQALQHNQGQHGGEHPSGSPPTVTVSSTSPLPDFPRAGLAGPPSASELPTSPHSLFSPQLRADNNTRFQALHEELVVSLLVAAPDSTLNELINFCIDISVQNVFPLGPLFHEPTLRAKLPLRWPELQYSCLEDVYAAAKSPEADINDIAMLRSYTELTALCASVAFLLPQDNCTNVILAGQAFLRTSREVLKCFHDFDVTHPSASSLVIRICQASALHTDGRTSLAWQTLDEALRLAEQMRLFTESSFGVLEPLEAQIRRLSFWQLYILDKYAALVESKPMRLHQFSVGAAITTALKGDNEVFLLARSPATGVPSSEEPLRAGFSMIQKLWTTASEVALDLQILSRLHSQAPNTVITEEAQKINLSDTYLRFAAVLDVLPPVLQSLSYESAPNSTHSVNPRWSFWLQRSHLLITFHCLRMVFLQRFAEVGLANVLGCTNDALMLASRKMEIAHEFVNVLNGIPFDCLRANGESGIAKIRRIGATVLEVMHHVENQQIVARARTIFPQLLDVLARLNSRASD